MVPLRVIEELDEKKYTARDDLAARARKLLGQLREQLLGAPGEPAVLRPNVTIECPVEAGPRNRMLDADREILDSCWELQVVGAPVLLITDDASMSLRAASLGITVVPMPERYLRKKLPRA